MFVFVYWNCVVGVMFRGYVCLMGLEFMFWKCCCRLVSWPELLVLLNGVVFVVCLGVCILVVWLIVAVFSLCLIWCVFVNRL